MLGRIAAGAALIALASCAGLEPAGRNAQRGPSASPPPPRTAPATPAPTRAAPPPQQQAPQQTAPVVTAPPQQQAAPVVTAPPPAAAPVVTAPPPAAAPVVTPPPAPRVQTQAPPPATAQVTAPPSTEPAPTAPARRSDDGDIVVPGQVETQVRPPAGDPRTVEQRRADIRAWDQCVMQVQNALDSDPLSPQLTTPEEYCQTTLGMSERTGVPASRRRN